MNEATQGELQVSSADLVRTIYSVAKARGISMSMHKGWNLVARLLYGKAYSQAIAAERAGKLPRPGLDATRTQTLRDGYYGWHVNSLVTIAEEVLEDINLFAP